MSVWAGNHVGTGTTAASVDAAEVRRLENEIRDIRWVDRQRSTRIETLRGNAREATHVRGQLVEQRQALHYLFMPIRGMHTARVWQGNAATESRRRLDLHEERFQAALRAVDVSVEQLEVHAATVERQVRDEQSASYRANREIDMLERALRDLSSR